MFLSVAGKEARLSKRAAACTKDKLCRKKRGGCYKPGKQPAGFTKVGKCGSKCRGKSCYKAKPGGSLSITSPSPVTTTTTTTTTTTAITTTTTTTTTTAITNITTTTTTTTITTSITTTSTTTTTSTLRPDGWGPWGNWTECSHARERTCLAEDASECPGEGSQVEECGPSTGIWLDTPYLSFTEPPTTTTSTFKGSVIDFYDMAMTHGINMTEVTCCTLDQRSITASCGEGLSCSAVCHSEDASLCPSGQCDDCETLPEEEDRSCVSSSPSSSCNRCVREGCRTKGSPGCCFNHICRRRRPRQCEWMRYYFSELSLLDQ